MILAPLVMHAVEITPPQVVKAHIKVLYKIFSQIDALVGGGGLYFYIFLGKFYDSCLTQGVYELIY